MILPPWRALPETVARVPGSSSASMTTESSVLYAAGQAADGNPTAHNPTVTPGAETRRGSRKLRGSATLRSNGRHRRSRDGANRWRDDANRRLSGDASRSRGGRMREGDLITGGEQMRGKSRV